MPHFGGMSDAGLVILLWERLSTEGTSFDGQVRRLKCCSQDTLASFMGHIPGPCGGVEPNRPTAEGAAGGSAAGDAEATSPWLYQGAVKGDAGLAGGGRAVASCGRVKHCWCICCSLTNSSNP